MRKLTGILALTLCFAVIASGTLMAGKPSKPSGKPVDSPHSSLVDFTGDMAGTCNTMIDNQEFALSAAFGEYQGTYVGKIILAYDRKNDNAMILCDCPVAGGIMRIVISGGEQPVNGKKFTSNVYHGPWDIRMVGSAEIIASGGNVLVEAQKID